MCPQNGHPYLERLTKNLQKTGVVVTGVPPFSLSNGLSIFTKFVKEARNADIIHFHWIPFSCYWIQPIVLNLCKLFNLKIVWTVHNIEPHFTRYTQKKDVMSYKRMIRHSKGLIFHSERSQDEFRKIYDTYFGLESVIPHGNYNEIAPKNLIENTKEFKAKCRKTLGLSDDKILLLLFPANRWTKGIKNFVDIVKRLDKKYIGILAGRCKDPEIQDYLSKINKKHPSKFIIQTGYASKKRMDTIFGATDIFLIPYTKITTSGSVLTALAYQLPIMSTNLGNIDMLVKNGYNGFICGNNDEFIKKIKSLDKSSLLMMGKKSRLIATKYDWETIAKDTKNFYSKIITNKNKKEKGK
jgi:glycosyltransferase involved in cell wall biosynthesis